MSFSALKRLSTYGFTDTTAIICLRLMISYCIAGASNILLLDQWCLMEETVWHGTQCHDVSNISLSSHMVIVYKTYILEILVVVLGISLKGLFDSSVR